jgi:hypothetical protein
MASGDQTIQRLLKIVLTGGPCGGKTTALAQLRERFAALGVTVFTVPALATLLIQGRINRRALDQQRLFHFQENLLRAQMALEDFALEGM